MNPEEQQPVAYDALNLWCDEVAKSLNLGDSICLSGPLGAGKTTFSFHIAKALGLHDSAAFSSPTFSIMNIYDSSFGTIRHLDLYRLNSFHEFANLDLPNELRKSDGISLVEWGGRFAELAPYFTHVLNIDFCPKDSEKRMVSFQVLKHD